MYFSIQFVIRIINMWSTCNTSQTKQLNDLLRIQIHYNIWLESFTSTDPSREWMKGFHFRMANLLYFRQGYLHILYIWLAVHLRSTTEMNINYLKLNKGHHFLEPLSQPRFVNSLLTNVFRTIYVESLLS